jgi:hypothetical protein
VIIVAGRSAIYSNLMENDPKIAELQRKLTPAQKLRTAQRLYWSARAWKAAAFRSLHPDWTEERVQSEVRHAFLTART